jgi:hypothetical protein
LKALRVLIDVSRAILQALDFGPRLDRHLAVRRIDDHARPAVVVGRPRMCFETLVRNLGAAPEPGEIRLAVVRLGWL